MRSRSGHDRSERFEPEPADALQERMAELAPRENRRASMTAFCNARLDGRGRIEPQDLPAAGAGKRAPPGFVH